MTARDLAKWLNHPIHAGALREGVRWARDQHLSALADDTESVTDVIVAEAKRRYPRDVGDELAFRQGAEEWIANDRPPAPECV